MLFNSYIFLLAFLPICLTGWFLLNKISNKIYANIFLVLMSICFYGWFNVSYIAIIVGSVIGNYLLSLVMREKRPTTRKILLTTGILSNITLLGYYKYFDFFIQNFNTVFKTDLPFKEIVLPLGISFFTFQQIAYIVDCYKDDTIKYTFIDYALFVTYFPQLIAGPIVNHDELIPQFKNAEKRLFDQANFSKGLYIFSLGLSKKVLLADLFGKTVTWGYWNIPSLSTLDALIIMLSYTLQIYFDFSGYCDMAIGIAKMMNIEIPLNFNSPYKADNISDFWKRWHITLTRFFRKYVYFPLGGNRKGRIRTYINIMIVFLISGLWHGAGWNFVIWGGLHGALIVLTRAFDSVIKKIPRIINKTITFIFINLLWVLFRAECVSDAVDLYKRIFVGGLLAVNERIINEFKSGIVYIIGDVLTIDTELINTFIMIAVFVFSLYLVFFYKNAFECMNNYKAKRTNLLFTAFLLGLCIISFSGVSTFLYFNF